MDAGWNQVDHTADLALELWAPSEPALLAAGARAVVAILTEDADVGGSATRRIELATVDAEDRLVQWLNEVILAAVVDGFLVSEASIDLDPGGERLVADVRGEAGAADRIRTELKSATYHDLRLARDDGTWRAHVVIDV